MRKQFLSFGALLVMIVLAFGSMDTSTVNTGSTNGTDATEETVPVDSSSDIAPTSDSAVPNDKTSPDTASNAPRAYKMNEAVHVGYTSYAVWKARWSDQLSDNQFLNQRPNASFLFLSLTVRNNDKKARSIPPFTLIDDNGAEYEASPDGWRVEGSIGLFDSLNPGVSKQGFVVFDVPRGQKYYLKVSGGYWSAEDTLIEILDSEEEQRQREFKEAEERKQYDAERLAAEKARQFEIETAKWRYWVSSSGKHRTHAKFIKAADGRVTLENRAGKRTEVLIEKLSKEDQEFIKNRGWLKPVVTPSDESNP